jgi:twitching motility protein PilT
MTEFRGQIQFGDLLSQMPKRGASDLHLSAGRYPAFRVDGSLVFDENMGVVQPDDVLRILTELMSDAQRSALEANRKITFTVTHQNQARLRIFAYFQKGILNASFRYLPFQIPDAQALGLDRASRILDLHSGLVIIGGPSSSGRTTTAVSIMDQFNHMETLHLITIEDPVEYVFIPDKSIIDQREIGVDVASIPEALRELRYMDADVIFVGDMYDAESVRRAIQAARMGYLIIGVTNALDGVNAVEDILSLFPGSEQDYIRRQLSFVLRSVISQRLLPRLGGGRVLAYESMYVDGSIKSMIQGNRMSQVSSKIQSGMHQGMMTLDTHLSELVKNNVVRAEHAEKFALDRELFGMQMRKN